MTTSNHAPGRRQFVSAAALGLAAPFLPGFARAQDAEAVIVDTANGKLRGMRQNGSVSFKGVPYAADTSGRNRFLAPQPVASWTGVRDALQYGDRCPQVDGKLPPVFSWYEQDTPFSENCCVLNVFSPGLDANARRPVIFYIHGGGFSRGGGGGPVLDGSKLAKFGDVVVVTLNHRLNSFGYTHLAHLEPMFADAANAGQLDLIAALNWVKTNIRAFGGDPGSVTLAGQSGGGSKIMTLLAMPAAKGLFHRAINMSGSSGLQLAPAASSEPLVAEVLRRLNLDKGSVHKLQDVPARELIAARRAAITALKADDSRPLIDGRHIHYGPLTPEGLALSASVPVMIGTTENEATLFMRDVRNFKVNAQQVRARIKAQYQLDDSKTDAVIQAYTRDVPNRTPADILMAVAGDALVRGPLLLAAGTLASSKRAPVYVYNFTWKIPADNGMWGAPHAVDIPFAFGNVDQTRATMSGPGPGPDEVARNLMSAFVAFARTGNPDNPRLPQWKPYDTADRATMTINEKCQLVNDFRGADRQANLDLGQQPTYLVTGGPLFRYGE
jgi:para-nitrobenzyl esterase